MKRFTSMMAAVTALVMAGGCSVAFAQYAPPRDRDSFEGLPDYPVRHGEFINFNVQSNLTVNNVAVLTNLPPGTLTNGTLYATAAQGAKADTALQAETDAAALLALGVASNALHAAVTNEAATARAAEALLLPKTATNGFTDIVYSNASQFQAAGNYATGTPVYAESDPLSVHLTNATYTATVALASSAYSAATGAQATADAAYPGNNPSNYVTAAAIPSATNYDAAGSAAAALVTVWGSNFVDRAAATNGMQSAGDYASNVDLTAHVTNTVPHVSTADRTNWNGVTNKATFSNLYQWASFVASTNIQWESAVIVTTNIIVTGTLNPDVSGTFVYDSGLGVFVKTINEVMCTITSEGISGITFNPTGLSSTWVKVGGEDYVGVYLALENSTGTATVAYSIVTNTVSIDGTSGTNINVTGSLSVNGSPVLTNAIDSVARANNVLTSNAIPTTADQVGAVSNSPEGIAAAGGLTNGGTTAFVGTSYSVVVTTVDSNTIVVTDADGSNPDAWGTYGKYGEAQNGWSWLYDAGYWDMVGNGADYYNMSSIPGDWQGSGGIASGAVHVVYGTITTTNLVADSTGLHGNGSDIHSVTGAVDEVARANITLVSNTIPTTAAQVGAVSNSPEGIAAAGGLTNITASMIANAGGLIETPYQPYTSTGVVVSGTCTVSYASGSLVLLTAPESPTTLTFDNAGYATNGVNRVAVELLAGTNSIAFATATITNSTAPTISTSTWTRLIFRRSGNDSQWIGGQVK